MGFEKPVSFAVTYQIHGNPNTIQFVVFEVFVIYFHILIDSITSSRTDFSL